MKALTTITVLLISFFAQGAALDTQDQVRQRLDEMKRDLSRARLERDLDRIRVQEQLDRQLQDRNYLQQQIENERYKPRRDGGY